MAPGQKKIAIIREIVSIFYTIIVDEAIQMGIHNIQFHDEIRKFP